MKYFLILSILVLTGCTKRVYYPGSPYPPPNKTIAEIYAPYRQATKARENSDTKETGPSDQFFDDLQYNKAWFKSDDILPKRLHGDYQQR